MSVTQELPKQSKKELFLPHIMNAIKSGRVPMRYSYEVGTVRHWYFMFGTLPLNKAVIYEDGKLEVVSSISEFGTPQKDGISYSAQSLFRFTGRNYNVAERELVLEARELLRKYKGVYS